MLNGGCRLYHRAYSSKIASGLNLRQCCPGPPVCRRYAVVAHVHNVCSGTWGRSCARASRKQKPTMVGCCVYVYDEIYKVKKLQKSVKINKKKKKNTSMSTFFILQFIRLVLFGILPGLTPLGGDRTMDDTCNFYCIHLSPYSYGGGVGGISISVY